MSDIEKNAEAARKTLERFGLSVSEAKEIAWALDDIEAWEEAKADWSKDDWPHASRRGCPRSGHEFYAATGR